MPTNTDTWPAKSNACFDAADRIGSLNDANDSIVAVIVTKYISDLVVKERATRPLDSIVAVNDITCPRCGIMATWRYI